jgi:hypothetical protein
MAQILLLLIQILVFLYYNKESAPIQPDDRASCMASRRATRLHWAHHYFDFSLVWARAAAPLLKQSSHARARAAALPPPPPPCAPPHGRSPPPKSGSLLACPLPTRDQGAPVLRHRSQSLSSLALCPSVTREHPFSATEVRLSPRLSSAHA